MEVVIRDYPAYVRKMYSGDYTRSTKIIKFGCQRVTKSELLNIKAYLQKKGGASTVEKVHKRCSHYYNLKGGIKSGTINTKKVNILLEMLKRGY